MSENQSGAAISVPLSKSFDWFELERWIGMYMQYYTIACCCRRCCYRSHHHYAIRLITSSYTIEHEPKRFSLNKSYWQRMIAYYFCCEQMGNISHDEGRRWFINNVNPVAGRERWANTWYGAIWPRPFFFSHDVLRRITTNNMPNEIYFQFCGETLRKNYETTKINTCDHIYPWRVLPRVTVVPIRLMGVYFLVSCWFNFEGTRLFNNKYIEPFFVIPTSYNLE